MRSKRLEDIEKKIADLKALAADEKRRLSTKNRKRETRRKILFTGEIYARLRQGEQITLVCHSENTTEQVTFHTIHDVEKWVLQHLSRPADLSAFDVDDTQENTKPVPAKTTKAKPQESPAAMVAPTVPHPATLPIVQAETLFPQSSTKEAQAPPTPKKAAKPANSNQPKGSRTGAKKLPEVGQEEMKKQFLM